MLFQLGNTEFLLRCSGRNREGRHLPAVADARTCDRAFIETIADLSDDGMPPFPGRSRQNQQPNSVAALLRSAGQISVRRTTYKITETDIGYGN
jgi:hypothetical protein